MSPSVYPTNIQNPKLIITMLVDVAACNSALAISWYNDDCEIMRYTVQCCYNLINFHQNSWNRYPIAHPWGQGMGCILWVQNLIHLLHQLLQCCMQNDVLFHHIITDCISFTVSSTVINSDNILLTRGPFYWHGLTLSTAWLSNYIHY